MIKRRGSGILLHISSLPSVCAIGGFGPWAYKFADFLEKAGQSYWQVLPLTPSGPGSCNSPYSSFSAFAGNGLFISAEMLVRDGLVGADDIKLDDASAAKVDYAKAIEFKNRILAKAFEKFKVKGKDCYFEEFCEKNSYWLDDFALFVSLSEHYHNKSWDHWDVKLRDRDKGAMDEVRKTFAQRIEREEFYQYTFWKQYLELKAYCNGKGIQIIGDIPIYVDYNCADVWARPGLFKLDGAKRPVCVAGVPPDYFSKTGQRWGNPVYDWGKLKESGYDWWVRRIGHMLEFYDWMRIDHFRGFVAYWEVEANEKTAINGKWAQGPGAELFNVLLKKFSSLPIIAEDLGLITADVREFIRELGLPGMKVLLFAFDESLAKNPYAPHNLERNAVMYTGTHDNNTVRGWFENETDEAMRNRLAVYLGHKPAAEWIHWDFVRMAMKSVASTAIIPMQDVLGLGGEARMNMPSTCEGNWSWRLDGKQLTDELAGKLRELTGITGRI